MLTSIILLHSKDEVTQTISISASRILICTFLKQDKLKWSFQQFPEVCHPEPFRYIYRYTFTFSVCLTLTQSIPPMETCKFVTT